MRRDHRVRGHGRRSTASASTSVAILAALHAEHGDQSCVAEPRLRRMVSAGHLGRKSGKGF